MNENKKIAFNSVIIFIRLVVTSLVGIYISRIVLDALGASDYGLYNVVGGIVTMLNVMNSAMLSTTYRYIAFDLGKGEQGDTRRVFNTCFQIHIFFAVFIIFSEKSNNFLPEYSLLPIFKLQKFPSSFAGIHPWNRRLPLYVRYILPLFIMKSR